MKANKLKTIATIALSLGIACAPAQRRGWQQTQLKQWSFSKDRTSWHDVSVPHSCNAIDGHSSSYYRGKAYYRYTLNIGRKDLQRPTFLLFEGAAQAATVSVGGRQAATHKGGYTPFVVPVSEYLSEGNNEISVCTDNTLDTSLIPVSSDFNKNNGLHYPVYLLQMNPVYLSPETYGMYRMHITAPYVDSLRASGKAETTIVNASGKRQKLKVTFTLSAPGAARAAYTSERTVEIAAGDSYNYLQEFAVDKPHLWNGTADPFLYDARISVSNTRGESLDEAETKTGFRYFHTTAGEGFYLNGRSYPLRGVSLHQDWDGQASAVTPEHTFTDYRIITDLGANFVRLAHYPHTDLELRICDSLGLVVQTEIPWVNVCGVNAKPEYFTNQNQQMSEMITNLYNHPSIVFWGMWNELDSWGNNADLQGKIDTRRIFQQTSQLYRLAKSIDPYRLVGMTDCSLFKRDGYTSLSGDFFSQNRYPDWYFKAEPDDLFRQISDVHRRMGVTCIAEYGGGANPFCHTLDSAQMRDRSDDSKHYEEWACYIHESDMKQILLMPWLNFTSLWIMFDFPVANRQEGYRDSPDGVNFTENENRKYMNDKGLVTRDRKTLKDPYFFYRSLWNKHAETVYITGRRRSGSPKDKPFNVKVYSNAHSLTLYQNGEKVQTLDSCPDVSGVIWTFEGVSYKTDSDTFRVVSDSGTTDEVTWKAL